MKPDYQLKHYTDPSLSAIHHALRTSRRRLVIGLVAYRVLSSAESTQPGTIPTKPASPDGVIGASQLAREITSIEENVPIEHATGDEYHNAYTALIQTHLPELDNLGAIEYDENRKQIRPDRNLLAMAIAAAITSPVAQMIFHNALSEHNLGGPRSLRDSTGD